MTVRGRFAPSPSGRMHLGNVMAALLVWLDVRSHGGTMVLRIEDLDPQRCTLERAHQLAEDLMWLGLDWDEGGVEPAYCQSHRTHYYAQAFSKLEAQGLIYPCYCTRAERMAASAPHTADGVTVYNGRCANLTWEERQVLEEQGRRPAYRVRVPNQEVSVEDGHMGRYAQNLDSGWGDYIVRRSDGVWSYQLAVVADDAQMGITHVVRGCDLLPSTPIQIWLHRVLGWEPPQYYHFPLLVDGKGRRLSKRDHDLDLGVLREKYTPQELVGVLAFRAGLLSEPKSVTPRELIPLFQWSKVPKKHIVFG